MPGGRQAPNQRRRPQASRKTITPSRHHHAHLRNPSTRSPPPRTPDCKKSERIRGGHEIWAARKKLQLKKENENENERLEASPVARLLLPQYQPKYVPMRTDIDDLWPGFDNFLLGIRRRYKPFLWPHYNKIVELDSSWFDDSLFEKLLDVMDDSFDEN